MAEDRAVQRTPQVTDALYRVAVAAGSARQMVEVYPVVHAIVGELMDAESFWICIYDQQRGRVSFPYCRDAGGRDVPDPNAWEPLGTGLAGRAMAEVLHAGEPATAADDNGHWLGVPLTVDQATLGALVVRNDGPDRPYTDADRDVLELVGRLVANALDRTLAIEETRQRNAELAVVNEISGALAKGLNFEAIIELVGQKVREIFDAQTMAIVLYDEATSTITFPFTIDGGVRASPPARRLGEGLNSIIISERRPLLFGAGEDADAAGAISFGNPSESWLGVPILAGDRVVGALNLEDVRSHAFGESDLRLLSTVASSLGVALDNARLFDETRRLLVETDQRAAELALVNEIGMALARQLDFGAVVELVGDRLTTIFSPHTRDFYVALYDQAANLISFPYEIDGGQRVHNEPIQLGQGLSSIVISSRKPLRLGSLAEQAALGGFLADAAAVAGATESWLGVPIPAGTDVMGLIALGNMAPNAFSEADERLVSTVASSMGVALENARLFDETKRLLMETDQRAAELALVNEIGGALAAQLDFQAITELVGEQVRLLFEAKSMFIALYDPGINEISFPYEVEEGERYYSAAMPLGEGLTSIVIRTREPLLLATSAEAERHGAILAGLRTESWLGVPILAGDRVLGAMALESLQPHAFSEADVRLLSNPRLEPERGARERAPRRRDAPARGRAGHRQQRWAGRSPGQLDLDALIALVGDQLRDTFDADIVYVALHDPEASMIEFPTTARTASRHPSRECDTARA